MMCAAALASCSSDYLDRAPITNIDETKMVETVENAQRALWGVCRSMYVGYEVGQNVQFINGEAFINTLYGEVFGPDYWSYRYTDFGPDMMDGTYLRINNYWMAQMPWMYSYNLINQTNKLINTLGVAEGDPALRDFVLAQALTLRAHSYVKLIQFYAPRYEDDPNGEELVAPLRLESSTGDKALSTMKEITTQIYKDLDDAIALYESCNKNRSYGFEPDIDVARGIYARIAILLHDWQKAADMAEAARADYPIMSNDEYLDGFCDANKEWMWYNENLVQDNETGNFSWGAMFACNGGYVSHWGVGAGAINYDLYRQMDNNDIRRALFFTPDKYLLRPLRASSFWNTTYVNETTMSLNNLNNGVPNIMANSVRLYANTMVPSKGMAYYQNQAYRMDGNADSDLTGVVPFGAQFKFWGQGPFANSSVPFMRGAELLFIQAEALYMLGEETEAINVLNEVNGLRIPGYSCTASGQALLDEIRLSKRIELWGEGFCWTDFKRWNLSFTRNPWIEGDINSNNIPQAFAKTVQSTDLAGWRIVIPNAETDYNDLVDRN